MTESVEHKELLKLVYTDELTHLYNRRYLREQIPKYLKQAWQKNLTVAFFMFDMDNFKSINDTYGHQAGDAALIHFAKIMVATFQRAGIPIRYAGDEFMAVSIGIDKQKAKEFGEAIGKKLTETPLPVDNAKLSLKCSIGVSLFPTDGKDVDTLFEKADEALYIAKHQGKGRVILYPDSGKLLTPEKLDSILANPYIVGRDEIIQFLEQHLSPNGDSNTFLTIIGADGTGKSRLIKFAESAANKRLLYCIKCKGYPFWQTEPYGVAFNALSTVFEQHTGLSEIVFSKLNDKYKQILKPRIFSWDTKEVLQTEETQKADNVAIFEALMSAMVIIRETGDGAILLDDIDLIDKPSLQFFDALFSDKESNKIHLVATINAQDYATGDEKILTLLGSMKEISVSAKLKKYELKPLGLEDIKQFTARVFNGENFSSDVENRLLHNSGGNPLFIVETVSFLLKNGKIQTAGDEWNLSDVAPNDIPLHLEYLLTERLMQMDTETINLLKLASVLGEKINTKQLTEMSGLKFHQVMDILGNAKRALLIDETPNPEEFIFSHRLDRSVFYSLLSEDERTKFHSLAAEIEQKFSKGALERVVGRLAYHYQNAGDLEKASRLFSSFQEQMEAVLISEGTKRVLQKRIITSSMAKESPLEEDDLGVAVECARAFKVAMQNLKLYPRENENVIKSVERFEKSLYGFLQEKTEALSISLTAETMLFNGQPPPPNKSDARLTGDLYSLMSSYALQGVLFIRGVTTDEIINFLEIFTAKPEEVATRWDEIVDERKLEHILPDRKIFVAVGEHKIALDERKLIAQTLGEGKEDKSAISVSAPSMSDEQADKIQKLVEEFKTDKEELIEALKSGTVDSNVIEKLINLLEQSSDVTEIAQTEKTKQEDDTTKQARTSEERYRDVLPDVDIINKSEKDVSLAFQDLSSDDTMTKARAAAWILKQDTEKVVTNAFGVICSDLPVRTRKLAAAVIAKMGNKAIDLFLNRINAGMSGTILKEFLDVADLFLENPNLLSKLSEIIMNGPSDAVIVCFHFIRKMTGKNVNPIILDLFERVSGKMKIEVLSLIVEKKINEAVPSLIESIKPVKIWEKDDNIQLQAQICKSLGMLKAYEAEDILLKIAIVPKPWTMIKPKPESIRVSAIWALKQLPKSDRIDSLLEKSKKSKSVAIRKVAGG